jgi:hypothetical protein
MRTNFALPLLFLTLSPLRAISCELPERESFYLEAMQEERDLTLQALAKSDQVLIGTVVKISELEHLHEPGKIVSAITVKIAQELLGPAEERTSVELQGNLHDVVVSCFGNESFWDDQVEVGKEYILFASKRKILSASPRAESWRRLGLAGQREVVLAALRGKS